MLSTVNCSATAVKRIVSRLRESGVLSGYGNIDGVVPLTHGTGCGMTLPGAGIDLLRRTRAQAAEIAPVDRRDEVALEFDQPVVWNDALAGQFYLDGAKGLVTSGSVAGKTVVLKLTAPTTSQRSRAS